MGFVRVEPLPLLWNCRGPGPPIGRHGFDSCVDEGLLAEAPGVFRLEGAVQGQVLHGAGEAI